MISLMTDVQHIEWNMNNFLYILIFYMLMYVFFTARYLYPQCNVETRSFYILKIILIFLFSLIWGSYDVIYSATTILLIQQNPKQHIHTHLLYIHPSIYSIIETQNESNKKMKRDVEEQQKTQNIIKNIFFIKKKPSELYQIKKFRFRVWDYT
jgi:hypothetical protein